MYVPYFEANIRDTNRQNVWEKPGKSLDLKRKKADEKKK